MNVASLVASLSKLELALLVTGAFVAWGTICALVALFFAGAYKDDPESVTESVTETKTQNPNTP